LSMPGTLDYNPPKLLQVLFSPDGEFVLVARRTRRNEPGVIVWNRRTGERVRDFPGLCLAITADGKLNECGEVRHFIDAGGVDQAEGGIQIYEFGTGKLVRKIETQETPIAALAFSPDGQTLTSIGCLPLRGEIERGGLGAPNPMGGYFRTWNM